MATYDGSREMSAHESLEEGNTAAALVHAVLAVCHRLDDLASLLSEEIARAAR